MAPSFVAVVTSLFFAGHAFASYCQGDNCLNAFRNRPTLASAFCSTYTTDYNTLTTALPTYATQCKNVPTRISSACTCLNNPGQTCPRQPLRNEDFYELQGPDARYWKFVDLPNRIGEPDQPPFPTYKFAVDPKNPGAGNAFQVTFPVGFPDTAPVTTVLLEQVMHGICDATYNINLRYRSDSPNNRASCAVQVLIGSFPPSLATDFSFTPSDDYKTLSTTFTLTGVPYYSDQTFYLGVGCRIPPNPESDLPATVFIDSVKVIKEA